MSALADAVERHLADPDEVIHVCSCGRSYTRAQWPGLLFVALHIEPEEHLEMRNCEACGSTRSLVTWTMPVIKTEVVP